MKKFLTALLVVFLLVMSAVVADPVIDISSASTSVTVGDVYSATINIIDDEDPTYTIDPLLVLLNPDGTGDLGITLDTSDDYTLDGWTVDSADACLTYDVVVEATSTEPVTVSETLTIFVDSGSVAPVITTTSLPAATVATAYSQTMAVTNPEAETLAFSITSGALPSGLTLNALTGEISGTPTADGLASFTVQVDDGVACSVATQALTLTVNAAAVNQAPSITTTSLVDATELIAYSATIGANDPEGDAVTFDFTGSVLPTGVTASTATGIVSGTPAAATEGTYTVVVNAIDSNGNVGTTVTLTLNVLGPNTLLAQYQASYLTLENLFDTYEDDLEDVEDDIEDECEDYVEAIEDDDEDDAEDAEDNLEDIEDDELADLEDNVDDLEDDVDNLLDDVENLPSSTAQRNLEDDLEDLLDDIAELQDDVENSFDDIDNLCEEDEEGESAEPVATTVYEPVTVPTVATVTTPVAAQPTETVAVVTTASTPQPAAQSFPSAAKVVIDSQSNQPSIGTIIGLSVIGLLLLALLVVLGVALVRR
jgi:hypothetical protein